MALAPCPDCGNQCSVLATACPKCGRPLASDMKPNQPLEKPHASALNPTVAPLNNNSAIAGLVVAAVIIVLALLCCMGGKGNRSSSDYQPSTYSTGSQIETNSNYQRTKPGYDPNAPLLPRYKGDVEPLYNEVERRKKEQGIDDKEAVRQIIEEQEKASPPQ